MLLVPERYVAFIVGAKRFTHRTSSNIRQITFPYPLDIYSSGQTALLVLCDLDHNAGHERYD